jgi:hypothetical protein
MFAYLHEIGYVLHWEQEQETKNGCGNQQTGKRCIENFFFFDVLCETEVGCFHAIRKNDVQKGSVRK